MTYNQALEIDRLSGVNGIDKALADFDLDAVIAPTDNPAWATDLLYGDRFLFGSSGLAAGAGYPIVQVPASMVFGAPLGISFFGTAFSEPTLIRLASGFEAVTRVRAQNPPTFALMLPDDHIDGTQRSGRPRAAQETQQGKQQKARRRKRGRGARAHVRLGQARESAGPQDRAFLVAPPTRQLHFSGAEMLNQRLRIDSATGAV